MNITRSLSYFVWGYKFTCFTLGSWNLTKGEVVGRRFIRYFNISYLQNRGSLVINRALLKYGYSNFSLEILEYCDIADLTKREQYYMDKLNPKYNTLKIAGSSSGYKQSEETKVKISKALKGVYTGEKSALYGSKMSKETKTLMS